MKLSGDLVSRSSAVFSSGPSVTLLLQNPAAGLLRREWRTWNEAFLQSRSVSTAPLSLG